jgi:general secretion pathway protein D
VEDAPAIPAGGVKDPLTDSVTLANGSLTDVIDLLARQLKMNYVLDPKLQGGITVYTHGEIKELDSRSLLELILRINGAGLVKQGDFFRIVPIGDVPRLSIFPEEHANADSIPNDDRTILDLVFVKYLSADELLTVLNPFLGENAKAFTYAPANLILVLDSRRNVRRLLELVSLFDDVKFSHERVRLYQIKSVRPSDLAKELESVLEPLWAAENFAPIKLLPVDRIRTIVAVARNPSMFSELEEWLRKLDVAGLPKADTPVNHVYKVKFGDAKELASSIMLLYGGGDAQTGPSGTRNAINPGGQSSTVGPSSSMASSVAGAPSGSRLSDSSPRNLSLSPALLGPAGSLGSAGPNDLTGTFLGSADARGLQRMLPRVVPRTASNTLLIQALPVDYESILGLLNELDVPPRQVLIEAKIYEVDLSHSFSSSISATLQAAGANTINQFLGNLSGNTTNLTIGALVGRSRQLLGAVQLEESENRAKVISAPSIVATDGVAATMNVGTTVPTLSAQAVTGVQQSGSSLFANTVVNQDSGITLTVTAHVNASGIVTMDVAQQISAPIPPAQAGIQSPSFSNRSVQTQVTIQDGDTIAIAGIIDEQSTSTTSGIPLLNRLPIIGMFFGSRAYNKERTELVIFITPRVIYDTNDITEATAELVEKIKGVAKILSREQ